MAEQQLALTIPPGITIIPFPIETEWCFYTSKDSIEKNNIPPDELKKIMFLKVDEGTKYLARLGFLPKDQCSPEAYLADCLRVFQQLAHVCTLPYGKGMYQHGSDLILTHASQDTKDVFKEMVDQLLTHSYSIFYWRPILKGNQPLHYNSPIPIKEFCTTCYHLPGVNCTRSVRACTGCNRVKYCSRECQKLDWPKHKQECVRRNREPTQ